LHGVRIQDTSPDESKSGATLRQFEEPLLAGGKIIETDHLVAVAEEPIHDVAADESRTACDETFHEYRISFLAALPNQQRGIVFWSLTCAQLLNQSGGIFKPLRDR
jgi:hypothetical protein